MTANEVYSFCIVWGLVIPVIIGAVINVVIWRSRC